MPGPAALLQQYLDGVVFDHAQLVFERGLDPLVRQAMRDAFPEDPQDPLLLEHQAATAAAAARIQQLEAHELLAAQAEIDRLKLNLKSCTIKADKKRLQLEYKAAVKVHSGLLKERDTCQAKMAIAPVPRWLHECKKPFGRSMQWWARDGPVTRQLAP